MYTSILTWGDLELFKGQIVHLKSSEKYFTISLRMVRVWGDFRERKGILRTEVSTITQIHSE